MRAIHAVSRTAAAKGADYHPLNARAAGRMLKLTLAERSSARISTMSAIDETPEQTELRRADDKRCRNRERARLRRAAAGATPRGMSLTALRPWEHFGISRRTWERRGRPDANSYPSNTEESLVMAADENASPAAMQVRPDGRRQGAACSSTEKCARRAPPAGGTGRATGTERLPMTISERALLALWRAPIACVRLRGDALSSSPPSSSGSKRVSEPASERTSERAQATAQHMGRASAPAENRNCSLKRSVPDERHGR